jgi:hypothetical protein
MNEKEECDLCDNPNSIEPAMVLCARHRNMTPEELEAEDKKVPEGVEIH